MKKLLFILTTLFLGTACTGDKKEIEGKWDIAVWEENGDIDENLTSSFTFNSDQTVIWERNGFTQTAEWSRQDGDSLYMVLDNDTLKLQYRFVDDKLKMDGRAGIHSFSMELEKADTIKENI